MKKVLLVSSESVPYIKTGGLADVVGTLPKKLDKSKFDVRVMIPLYSCIKEELKSTMKYLTHFEMDISWRKIYVGVFEAEYEGVHFYFIDNEYYFNVQTPYSNIAYDIEKFAYFSKAVLSALPQIGFRPDVIHCNDWQTGLVPVFLNDSFQGDPFFHNMKTIMTIHNLRFQGRWNVDDVMDKTGLSSYYFTNDKLEAYGDANLLKGGIVYADVVTTVSPNYANEIKTEFFGEGLDGLLRARSNDLVGILNGIDYDTYNPKTDKYIYKNYSVADFRKNKVQNKLKLQEELCIEISKDRFLLGICSRLTDQKGIDLIECVLQDLVNDGMQLVILGTGDEKYENLFRHFAWKYPEQISANIMYSDELSHKIYAGCDAYLMPSLYEPCGLSQIMSLRYGTVPIVRETGGLSDTVEPLNEYENTGVGFSFRNYNAHEMLGIIRYAKHIYSNRKRLFNKMVERGMNRDYSWKNSAQEYGKLYERL